MKLILLSLIFAAAPVQVEITTLDEQSTRGELKSLSSQQVVLRAGDEDVTLPVEKLLAIDMPAPADDEARSPTSTKVQLTDDSILPADSYGVKEGQASIALPQGQPVKLPARQVRSVRFLEQDEEVRALWNQILADDLRGDAVVVRKGGNGKPVVLDYLEGVIGEVDDKTIRFQLDGEEIPVNRERVQVEGLVYYRPTAKPAEPLCHIEAAGGARWSVSTLDLLEDALQLKTPAGIATSLPLARVRRFDFSLGKIVYLSDLEPLKKEWQPYLSASETSGSAEQLFGLRRDRNFAGKPLSLGETPFRKGLALHSRYELTYRLPDEFTRLVTVAGIDPAQRRHGHVRLEIRGDDRVLFNRPLAGDDAPQPLEIDVTGVGRLTILVDYGRGLDIGDQLILGNARLIR